MRMWKKKWGTILFTFLENRFFKPESKNPVDLKKDLHGVEALNCQVEQKGYSEYFPEPDLARIREYHLDFILRFGFNIIRGGILDAARFGTW